MVIEIILIILGILTAVLGLWNIIIGAYIWGTLFLIGGAWSISLGTLYILQLKKAKQNKKEEPEVAPQTETKPVDEGLLTQDLFATDEEIEIKDSNDEENLPELESIDIEISENPAEKEKTDTTDSENISESSKNSEKSEK